ncbi:MAG: hypothetical protein IJ179_08425 [Oscillospiraceae bacterium]|nr:hypothetical protein [Oscillospiraceae bacterium]
MDVMTEQLNLDVLPLPVHCVHCGAEANYDLARQNYHCLFCGKSTPVQQPLRYAQDWQEQQLSLLRQRLWDEEAALYRCPGCGAVTLSARAAAADCAFCGCELQRGAMSRDLDLPTLALPFVLSVEDAGRALKSWAGKNRLQKEARRVEKAVDRLEACYLPCELLEGPVGFQVTRRACARSYSCRSSADDVLVNSSAQVDSLLLSAVEPFDWRPLRPLDGALPDAVRLKLRDLPEALLEHRIDEELAMHHLGAVERTLHSSDLQLQPDRSDTLCLSVLVPVYLLTIDGTRVMINGQNGRVAVSRDKRVRSHQWLMEPLILSLLATLFWIYASTGNLELFILGTAASVVLIFALLGGERGERLHRRLFRIRDPLTERYEGRFYTSSPAEAGAAKPAPELRFYEAPDGERIPVEIRYYTAKRICLFLLFTLGVLALPWLLCVVITGLRMLSGAEIQLAQIETAYGAVWYVLALAAVFLGCLSLGRSLVFDHPILYRSMPDGSMNPIPPKKSAPGRLSLWARLRRLFRADAIVGLAFAALVVLIGSVLAMMP